eukprot:CCRYP_000825-RB/>CCRYP_000825-RB protein AED:0.05 eAED:0.05 QI:342/1/1/1/1/1/9/177/1131
MTGDSPVADRLDEEAEKQRQSKLLSCIGKFLPTLQLASNGTARLRRLVKNMVVQLGGCATPAAVPFYFDRHSEAERNEAKNEDKESKSLEAKKDEQSMQPPVFGSEVSFIVLGRAIGTALRILITVDSAIASNEDLREAWAMYKEVVMDHSEEKRAANKLDKEFESFERMLVQLDFSLMSCRSFVSTIEQNFDPRGRFQDAGFKMHERIHSIISTLYGQYCERINTEHETTERLDCVGAYAMYVMYRHLLPSKVIPDAKLHKSLWSVFPAMCPILELYGPLFFIPREFIMTYAPYEAVKGCSADVGEIRQAAAALVLKWDGSFKARVNKIRLDALAWLAIADAELSSTAGVEHNRDDREDEGDFDNSDFNAVTSIANIERATSCILRGMKIAFSAAITLRSQLITHRALGLELGQNSDYVASYLSLIFVLKSVEKMLRVRRRTAVLAFHRATLKMIASNILKRFETIRAFIDQSSTDASRSSERAISFARVSACLSALEGILKGSSSFSPARRFSVSFAIAACMDSDVLRTLVTDDLIAIEGHLKDLNEVSSIEEIQQKVCDCSFIYFYRDLYPIFFDSLHETSVNSIFGHTHLVMSALSDPERILKHVKHINSDDMNGSVVRETAYQVYLFRLIREKLVAPVCEIVEFNVRLAYHSKNDTKQSPNSNENTEFDHRRVRAVVQSLPIYVCQKKILLKTEVEEALSRTFYNLSALNLNDRNAYTEMRSLANERYGLTLLDPFLPDGSVGQTLNLVDILSDFEALISKYNYNMMEQTFIERKPERGAKFLATFGVKCILASIAQHGVGIIVPAIDISYKALVKKFHHLNQVLANDFVKSLLAKEFRWLNNHKNECNNIYPFQRALLLAQEINKITSDSDQSCFDECRTILGDMGNIISFVRLIRAARKKLSSNKMPYLPAPRTSPEHHSSLSVSELESRARVETDKLILDTLQQNDSDFVRAFVDVFKGVSPNSNNPSMSFFFCLVPCLCLCWMEASLQGKEMMHKKNITRDGYFTDDGFAVGLTFCLVVLDQIKQCESLHWFKSVQSKYATDEEDLIEKENAEEVKTNAKLVANKQWFSSGVGGATAEASDETTVLKMMRKRLEGNKREMAMLFFSMHGAERFFKDIQSASV